MGAADVPEGQGQELSESRCPVTLGSGKDNPARVKQPDQQGSRLQVEEWRGQGTLSHPYHSTGRTRYETAPFYRTKDSDLGLKTDKEPL